MITLGGFLDSYYAYDFNQPDLKRAYTTQPIRHDQPSINLAHLEMKIQTQRLRSRLALQAGDSVERNASMEKGPEKYIQEAYLGVKLGEKTWVDAGIFLAHLGAESWISKDNWTYTRSLNRDYVPYYSAGIRVEHQTTVKQSAQLLFLNGWQKISDDNQAKAVAMQYKNSISSSLAFTYNNFFGDEEVTGGPSRFRSYHNIILQWLSSEQWQFLYSFDVGEQAQLTNNGIDPWYATSLIALRILNSEQSISLRAEYYNDRHQNNVVTDTPDGFQVVAASFNFDQKIKKYALWRTELRGFYSKDEIYPSNNKNQKHLDAFLVTSLSVWF